MPLLYRNPNVFYGFGRRVHRRHRRRARGGNILSTISDFLKKHKVISRIGSTLSAAGVPYAGAIGKAADLVGYGRRRRRHVGMRRRRYGYGDGRRRYGYGDGRRRVYRRRHGGSLKSILSAGHKFIKDNRLVSKGLRHFLPNSNLHKAAHTLGYGMRRRRVYRRRSGGSLKSILSAGHKFIKDNRLVSKGLRTFLPNSNLHKAAHSLGYGMRHHYRRYGGGNGDYFSTSQIAVPKF